MIVGDESPGRSSTCTLSRLELERISSFRHTKRCDVEVLSTELHLIASSSVAAEFGLALQTVGRRIHVQPQQCCRPAFASFASQAATWHPHRA